MNGTSGGMAGYEVPGQAALSHTLWSEKSGAKERVPPLTPNIRPI